MFDALDEAIKNLLTREIPIRQNEIEIVFDQPTQEWSARVGQPTLNVYLYDVRENRQLRGAEQFSETSRPDGKVEIRRNPVRIDVSYLVTAWARKEVDQHHLLGLAMMALLRTPFLPEEVCPDALKGHLIPIPLEVAHVTDESKDWSDFWSTMNNRLRPGVTLTATLMLDPYLPLVAAPVHSTELRFQQTDNPLRPSARSLESSPDSAASDSVGTGPLSAKIDLESKRYWQLSGEIVSTKYDPRALSLFWEERGQALVIEGGRFQLFNVNAGTHHLLVRLQDRLLKRHSFNVPSGESLIIEV